MPVESSHEQFLLDLGEIYDAEQQFLNGMLQMEMEARDERLGALLREHILQTEQHVKNLDKVYDVLHEVRRDIRNEAAAALVTSTIMAMQRAATDELRDTALDTSAIKNEQYEIASYRPLIVAATRHGKERVASLLRENLQDEEEAARLFEDHVPFLVQRAIAKEIEEEHEKQ